MCECCQLSSVEYFDSIASKWDSWHDLESLNANFDNWLKRFGLRPDECILDVGCGTGNLTSAIIRQMSDLGRVTAIDSSKSMVDIARAKINDSRITWVCDAVEHIDTAEMFHRIICFSVWPHLTDVKGTGQLFWKLLKTGGKLHIWHIISREAVNKIHSEASEAVSNHLLAPAKDTASLLTQSGFAVEEIQDDKNGYLVTVCKA